MGQTFTIPVVDLNDYLSQDKGRQQTFINDVGQALRDVGFFALTNHGVDQKDVNEAYQTVSHLFELPESTKQKYEDTKIKGQRGYISFGKEHAKDSNAPDLKEFWHMGQELPAEQLKANNYPANVWPSEVPTFKPVMSRLFTALEKCSIKVLEACSLYAGENKEVMSEIAINGNSILRLIHYPPIPEDRHPNSIRAAAHEDINLITLLIDATAPGLELLSKEGKWIPVVTPESCIIVDSGDMLQNLTNGYYRSTTHRVVNPNNSRARRFSMPFFVHARGEVSLNPLASCVAKTGGTKTYRDITAGEYLHQRLREIGLG